MQSGDQRFGHGYLAPNAHKSYHGSMMIKKNPKPVVFWKVDGTNDLKNMTVDMPDGSTFGKTIVFEIIGDHVRAYYD